MSKNRIWMLAVAGAFLVLAALAAATTPRSRMMDGMSVGSSGGADYAAVPTMGNAFRQEIIAADESRPMIPTEPPTAGETAAEVDQKIIKTGNLDLTVDDVSETETRIAQLATGSDGYVQDSDLSERADGTHFGNVTVRVPSETFESTMETIKSFAVTVRTESAQGQDVTEQYTDLEAQLRNARAQETEYLRILTQAKTVEEILQVQSYLSSVRGQIESLEGRIQYLENRTSYSTISVRLTEETSVRIPTKDFRLGSTVREAFQGLVAILQNLAVFVVWFAIVGGGTLIPSVVLIWILIKIAVNARRRYGKKTPGARN